MNAPLSPEHYFDRLEGFFSPDHPDLGTAPVPVEPYISPAWFEKERERVFRKSWFLFGHQSDLPEPGSYVVKELPALRTTVLLTRAKDGRVRAFHNVCTHRGNQLEYECGKGRKSHFVCKFHSWSFDLTGQLRGVPEDDRFPGLDKASRNLAPLGLAEWKGFLFVHADPEPAVPLVDYLGSMATDLEGFPFEKLRLAARWSSTLKANWKAVIDAFQEAYHVTTVHRHTVPNYYRTTRSGQLRVSSFRRHGSNRSLTSPRNPHHVPTPIEALGVGLAFPSLGFTPDMQLWPGLNPQGYPSEAYGFDVNVVFPTSFIDTAQGLTFTYEMHPIAVDETRFEARLYLATPSTWGERIGQEFLINQLRENLLEDLNQIEAVQRGMSSGAIREIVLSDQEIAVRHNNHVVAQMVNGR